MHLSKTGVSYNPFMASLYERYAPSLFAYLCRHTASREDAEDVLVEVFVAAIEYEHLPLLSETEQSFWLWRVCRNKAVDTYRRSRLRQGTTLERFLDNIYEDDERAPEQVLLRHEEYRELHNYLQRLSPLQKEAMRLRFADDLRCSEIAEVLGKREGTIRVLLSRTLNFLRNIYEKEHEKSNDPQS